MNGTIDAKENNNQINIVLNHRKKISLPAAENKTVISSETTTKHEMLQRIEEEMGKLVGMDDIKDNKRNICLDLCK